MIVPPVPLRLRVLISHAITYTAIGLIRLATWIAPETVGHEREADVTIVTRDICDKRDIPASFSPKRKVSPCTFEVAALAFDLSPMGDISESQRASVARALYSLQASGHVDRLFIGRHGRTYWGLAAYAKDYHARTAAMFGGGR